MCGVLSLQGYDGLAGARGPPGEPGPFVSTGLQLTHSYFIDLALSGAYIDFFLLRFMVVWVVIILVLQHSHT